MYATRYRCCPAHAAAPGPAPVGLAGPPLPAEKSGVVCTGEPQVPARHLETKMRLKPISTVAVLLRNVGKSGG